MTANTEQCEMFAEHNALLDRDMDALLERAKVRVLMRDFYKRHPEMKEDDALNRAPAEHGELVKQLKDMRARGGNDISVRWETMDLIIEALSAEPATDPECETCGNHGIVPVGTSGKEEDGNATEYGRCPDCGYGSTEPDSDNIALLEELDRHIKSIRKFESKVYNLGECLLCCKEAIEAKTALEVKE